MDFLWKNLPTLVKSPKKLPIIVSNMADKFRVCVSCLYARQYMYNHFITSPHQHNR
jgi:hypothetical protein